MKNFTQMTTEELTNNMELLMRSFEKTTDQKTKMLLANTIGSIEKIRDLKSWA